MKIIVSERGIDVTGTKLSRGPGPGCRYRNRRASSGPGSGTDSRLPGLTGPGSGGHRPSSSVCGTPAGGAWEMAGLMRGGGCADLCDAAQLRSEPESHSVTGSAPVGYSQPRRGASRLRASSESWGSVVIRRPGPCCTVSAPSWCGRVESARQGVVEVDESFFGGEEAGSGGRHRGNKVLVGVAVEVHAPNGFGRCRMATLDDSSAASLHPFVTANVEAGATVITDAWTGYVGLEKLGYQHQPRSHRAARLAGEEVNQLLAGAHRVDSLAKRWLLGTHQGSVDSAHLRADPRRVRFSLQPSRFSQPGTCLPPSAPARGRPPAGALFGTHRRTVAHWPTARHRRRFAHPEPRTPPCTPTLAGGIRFLVRLRVYPHRVKTFQRFPQDGCYCYWPASTIRGVPVDAKSGA